MGETEEVVDHKRTLRLELADTARLPIQVRLSPAAFSGFSRWLLSTFQLLPSGLPMPSENWDTTSCVHPLHYLPSERRVAPCPPKARSADFSPYARTLLPTGKWRINRHATSPSIISCRESSLISTWNIVLFPPSAPRDVFLSIELNISSRVTLDFGYMRIGF